MRKICLTYHDMWVALLRTSQTKDMRSYCRQRELPTTRTRRPRFASHVPGSQQASRPGRIADEALSTEFISHELQCTIFIISNLAARADSSIVRHHIN
jgi:hypothetical protein